MTFGCLLFIYFTIPPELLPSGSCHCFSSFVLFLFCPCPQQHCSIHMPSHAVSENGSFRAFQCSVHIYSNPSQCHWQPFHSSLIYRRWVSVMTIIGLSVAADLCSPPTLPLGLYLIILSCLPPHLSGHLFFCPFACSSSVQTKTSALHILPRFLVPFLLSPFRSQKVFLIFSVNSAF